MKNIIKVLFTAVLAVACFQFAVAALPKPKNKLPDNIKAPGVWKIGGYAPKDHMSFTSAISRANAQWIIQKLIDEQTQWGWAVGGGGQYYSFRAYEPRVRVYWKAYDEALNQFKIFKVYKVMAKDPYNTGRSSVIRNVIYYKYVGNKKNGRYPKAIPDSFIQFSDKDKTPTQLYKLAYTRYNEVLDIRAKIDKKWTIGNVLGILPVIVTKDIKVDPRKQALEIWGFNKSVTRFDEFVSLAQAMANPETGCTSITNKATTINRLLVPAHAKGLLALCKGAKKLPSKGALIKAAKRADYKFVIPGGQATRTARKSTMEERQKAILAMEAATAKAMEFKCESDDSLFSVTGALEYDEAVLKDKNSNIAEKGLAFLSAGIIRQFKVAEFECSAQAAGWHSGDLTKPTEERKRLLMKDSLGLFLNGVNVVSSILAVGGANKAADLVTIIVEPYATAANKANATCVEFPPGTQFVGFGIDGVGMVRNLAKGMKGTVTAYLTFNSAPARETLKEMAPELVNYGMSKGTTIAIEHIKASCFAPGGEEGGE